MQFVAVGSEFSGLPGYQLTIFDFCPGTLKKSLKMAFSDTLLPILFNFAGRFFFIIDGVCLKKDKYEVSFDLIKI